MFSADTRVVYVCTPPSSSFLLLRINLLPSPFFDLRPTLSCYLLSQVSVISNETVVEVDVVETITTPPPAPPPSSTTNYTYYNPGVNGQEHEIIVKHTNITTITHSQAPNEHPGGTFVPGHPVTFTTPEYVKNPLCNHNHHCSER